MLGYLIIGVLTAGTSLVSWLRNTWSLPTRRTARERLISRNPYMNELDWSAVPAVTRALRDVAIDAAVAVRSVRYNVVVTVIELIGALTLLLPAVPTGTDDRRSRHASQLEVALNATGIVT